MDGISEDRAEFIADEIEATRLKREKILEKISGAFPREVQLLRAYDSLLMALTPAEPAQENLKDQAEPLESYGAYRSPSAALIAYLTKWGPTPRLRVIDEITSRGWATGNPRSKKLIRNAIAYQLSLDSPGIALKEGDVLALVD